MTEPREVELKLDIDPADLPNLTTRVLPRLGRGGGSKRLVSVYYDTPDRILRARGMSLRLRSEAGRTVQTAKASDRNGAGLFDRSEWETEVPAGTLDLAAIRATPLAEALAKGKGPPQPVFETVVERTVWIAESDGAVVELALDQGHVTDGSATQPLAELELELKRGPATVLYDLLRELGEVASPRIGVVAKSERGYRLGKAQDQPVKGAPVRLEPGMTAAAAFQAVLHGCLRQFRLNEPLVVERRMPEGLHQARVAMRRLRSALSLFGPVVADGEIDGLKEGLQHVSRALGDARNLDVYLARVARPQAQDHGGAPGVLGYVADVEARRVVAYDRIVALLASREVRRLFLRLLAWVENGAWRTDADPLRAARREQPIEAFAAGVLETRRRKVVRKGRHLDALDSPARHRVRIQAKKLRYATEFFASLCGRRKDRRRHARFVEAMEELQAQLGDLNDIQAGHDLAADLAAGAPDARREPPEVAFAAGHLAGEQDALVDSLLARAIEAHAAVADAPRFWTWWTAKGAGRGHGGPASRA